MEDIEQFIQTHADANGNVSDADMARLLTGGHQGDTAAGKPADTGVPAAGSDANDTKQPAAGNTASQPEPKPAETPSAAVDEPLVDESKVVILAKDGVHTIPFEKLASVREENGQLRKQLADLLAKAPAAPAAAAAAPEGGEAPAAITADVFGDFSAEAIKKGVEAITAAAVGKSKSELAAELAPLKQHQADQAASLHFSTIYTKHPDLDSVVDSTQFAGWMDAQPSFVRDAYKHVLEKGTATQVVEMLDTYRAAHPAKAPAAAATAAPANVDAQVEKVIANAKTKAPNSLSDIPAATAAHHDEASAMAEMSTTDLMTKFANKSPAEIEALVRRLV